MRKSLLDTDILSDVLRGKRVDLVARAKAYRNAHGRLTISAMTVLEIVKGLQQSERQDKIAPWLALASADEVLPLGTDEAALAGRIYGELERTGQSIGRADPVIAATALSHGLVLVTGNTAHFERVRKLGYQLELADWRVQ